jgi:hypothetical protein
MGALPIVDLARIIAPDSDIIGTGLRLCEKLHEDLVHTDETALDVTGHYCLVRNGNLGITYTSEHAPRLSADAFLAMLHEAEANE